MSISDNDNRYLSDIVYTTDQKHSKYNPDIKEDTVIDVKGSDYQVLKLKDNPENGMQAMAVASIKNGKPDTSQVVIAFAGTNADDGLDILTDTQTVGLNKDTLNISTKLNFNGYNK